MSEEASLRPEAASPRTPRSESSTGVLAALVAYFLWGIVPLYWPLVKPAGAVELLAHRIVWSLVVAVALGAVLKVAWLPVFRQRRTLALLGLASVLIAVNWGTYIWAVNNDHVVEAALGYYINPLLSIIAGVLLLRERLRRIQWIAVGIAVVAVAVLTLQYGHPPFIALTLATSFACYGICKKHVRVPAVASLIIESLLMSLPALGYLVWQWTTGAGTFARLGLGHDLLLASSGIVTVVPLILFAVAAPRIPLSTMGLLQYVAPTMQFLLGVWWFGEAMPLARWFGFGLVWIALVLITIDGLRRLRPRPQPAATP